MGSGFRSCIFFALSVLSLVNVVLSQSSSSSPQSDSVSLSTTLTTGSFSTTITSTSGTRTVIQATVLPTVFNVTVTPTATSASSTSSSNSTASSTPSATPITLDTRIDPAFGVLGGILIVTGLPSAFWGHKNRWSSFFLSGFYTLALACLALILKFGVLSAVNPPSQSLRGVFVLACGVAGVAGGGTAIFFWHQAKYFIGGWGGFAFALWIMYIALGVLGFILCTIPKIHYQVLLISTAVVGASAFMLGVDCFSTAGLKEFYVWNLGFDGLFPKYQNAGINFPISQLMEVELGLIAAVALMGTAVQWRVLRLLQYKLKEISEEQRRRDRELESQAAAKFAGTAKELEEWEKEHGRKDSEFSNVPLIPYQDASTPATEEASQFTLVPGERRTRYQSGVSDFLAAPAPGEDESGRPRDRRQSIGVLPAMDLGRDIEEDIPRDFVKDKQDKQDKVEGKKAATAEELDDLRRQEELLAEIHNIRKSIEILRADTPVSSTPSESKNASRHPSFTSRRTLSQDLGRVMEARASRPPRSDDPRARVLSMDMTTDASRSSIADMRTTAEVGASIGRPTSAPLRNDDWDTYVSERKLFRPPSGVTAPISPQPKRASQFLTMPNAVSEALVRRQQQEVALELGELGYVPSAAHKSASTNQKLTSEEQHVRSVPRSHAVKKTHSTSMNVPVTILPPAKAGTTAPAPERPSAPRTYTFEELTERHREKMRNLQAPLSQAEKEQADLVAARSRWEKSRAVEKQAMERREAEISAQAKQADKKKVEGGIQPDKRASKLFQDLPESHTLNADRLLRLIPGQGSSSKRQSLLKVEDWQRYQQEVGASRAQEQPSKRDSNVPFPVAPREPGHPSTDRRRSSRLIGSPRDPPN